MYLHRSNQKNISTALKKTRLDFSKSEQLINAASLAVFALYLLRTASNRTLYRGVWPTWYSLGNLRIIVIILILLRFIQTDFRRTFTTRQWIAVAGIELILSLCYYSTRYDFALDVGVYMLLFAGVSMYGPLKVYLVVTSYVYLCALIGSLSGAIQDLVYYRYIEDSVRIRHSLGVAYPTDCAAAWFYLLLAIWFLAKRIYPIISIIIAGISSYLMMRICDARNSAVCMMAAIIGIVYYCLSETVIRKRGKKGVCIRILDGMMTAAFPVFAIIMVILSWLSPRIDAYLNNRGIGSEFFNFIFRLRLAGRAFRQYGVSLFGKPFTMIGAGSSNFYNGAKPGYNFVDCSYCMIFVRYGVVVLILFSFLYVAVCRRAIKLGQRKILIVMALIALHNVSEHHYTELCYNFMLLLPFAKMGYPSGSFLKYNSRTKSDDRQPGLSWRLLLYVLVVVCLCIFFFPKILSIGRTIVTVGSFAAKSRRKKYMFGTAALLIGVTVLFTFIWLLAVEIYKKYKGHKELSSESSARDLKVRIMVLSSGLIGVIAALVIGGLWVKNVIANGESRYRQTLEESASVFEVLQSGASDGKFRIFVDDIPELYQKKYGKGIISDHVYTEEGLCEEDEAVIITKRENELNVLIQTGFLYTELSDKQGLYTNSEEAAALLSEHGVNLAAVYTSKKQVDISKFESQSKRVLTDDGAIIIDGNDEEANCIVTKNSFAIHRGTLLVDFEIELISSDNERGPVGKAWIQTDQSSEPLGSCEIDLSRIDETGKCIISVRADLPTDTAGIRFSVSSYPGTELKLKSVEYGRI